MYATQTEELLQSDSLYYHSQINKIIEQTQPKFDRTLKFHLFFHIFFILLGIVEVVLLTVFFAFLAQSYLLAASFSFTFLTFFSYFILRISFQTKKNTQFKKLKAVYEMTCKQLIHYQEGHAEHHVVLANAYSKWAVALQNWESHFFSPPKWLDFLAPVMERWSEYCFIEDVLKMRELLLNAAIEEHIKLVKCEPTGLEVHTSLANAYIMLSSLYRKDQGEEQEKWLSNPRLIREMEEKFRQTAKRAIEEFKILSDYAPDEPWVHLQLAYSYHDLQMPEEEMRSYETILSLNPDDSETLYKLGVLYFQQGHNAKGLYIYDRLKRTSYLQAENLIEYYGIH